MFQKGLFSGFAIGPCARCLFFQEYRVKKVPYALFYNKTFLNHLDKTCVLSVKKHQIPTMATATFVYNCEACQVALSVPVGEQMTLVTCGVCNVNSWAFNPNHQYNEETESDSNAKPKVKPKDKAEVKAKGKPKGKKRKRASDRVKDAMRKNEHAGHEALIDALFFKSSFMRGAPITYPQTAKDWIMAMPQAERSLYLLPYFTPRERLQLMSVPRLEGAETDNFIKSHPKFDKWCEMAVGDPLTKESMLTHFELARFSMSFNKLWTKFAELNTSPGIYHESRLFFVYPEQCRHVFRMKGDTTSFWKVDSRLMMHLIFVVESIVAHALTDDIYLMVMGYLFGFDVNAEAEEKRRRQFIDKSALNAEHAAYLYLERDIFLKRHSRHDELNAARMAWQNKRQ